MKTLKNTVKIILFLSIILLICSRLQVIVSPKFDASQGMRSGFDKEAQDSIDVLFLGTSNMFHTINPIFLYEETGIRSFDFGSSSQSLNMSYMYLKEALKSQNPEIVCLELLGCRGDFVNDLYEPGLRWGFTYFPASKEKWEGLNKQLGKFDADYLSYIFPIVRYKDRWKELNEADFEENVNGQYWKGCSVALNAVEVSYGSEYYAPDETWKIAASNMEMLDNIRKLCEERDIELVFFKAPTPTLWKQVYSERIKEYADTYGIPFIDYNEKIDELGIDVKTDFKDAGHVNVYGSKKITDDFGKYLKRNYNLKDYRGGMINSWDRSVAEKNRRYANRQLCSAENLESFLMKISDDDYTIVCILSGEIDSEQRQSLNHYLNIDGVLRIDACVRVNGENVFLTDNCHSYEWHDSFENQDYAMNCVSRDTDDSYIPSLYVGGKNYIKVQHGINITVVDNSLEEVIMSVGFDADNNYSKVI